MRRYGPIRADSGWYGPIQANLGQFGPIRPIQADTGRYGPIRADSGQFGPIRDPENGEPETKLMPAQTRKKSHLPGNKSWVWGWRQTFFLTSNFAFRFTPALLKIFISMHQSWKQMELSSREHACRAKPLRFEYQRVVGFFSSLLYPISTASFILGPHRCATLLIFIKKYAQPCSLRQSKLNAHRLSKKCIRVITFLTVFGWLEPISRLFCLTFSTQWFLIKAPLFY